MASVDTNNCHLIQGNPHSDLVHGIYLTGVLDKGQMQIA